MVLLLCVSVVILIIDDERIAVFEAERHPPVAVHLYSPLSGKLALQRMQLPSGLVHLAYLFGQIEPVKLKGQFASIAPVESLP